MSVMDIIRQGVPKAEFFSVPQFYKVGWYFQKFYKV